MENAFGILASRFRVFLTTIPLTPENTEKVALASCALHNFLQARSTRYASTDFVDVEKEDGTVQLTWVFGEMKTQGMEPLRLQQGNRYTLEAKEVRAKLCNYFNNYGQVPWQNNYI